MEVTLQLPGYITWGRLPLPLNINSGVVILSIFNTKSCKICFDLEVLDKLAQGLINFVRGGAAAGVEM